MARSGVALLLYFGLFTTVQLYRGRRYTNENCRFWKSTFDSILRYLDVAILPFLTGAVEGKQKTRQHYFTWPSMFTTLYLHNHTSDWNVGYWIWKRTLNSIRNYLNVAIFWVLTGAAKGKQKNPPQSLHQIINVHHSISPPPYKLSEWGLHIPKEHIGLYKKALQRRYIVTSHWCSRGNGKNSAEIVPCNSTSRSL